MKTSSQFLLVLIVLLAGLADGAYAQGKGGGKKPQGEADEAACLEIVGGTALIDDGSFGGIYCNGTDGQVTVAPDGGLVWSLKKFNPNDRSLTVDAVCVGDCPNEAPPLTSSNGTTWELEFSDGPSIHSTQRTEGGKFAFDQLQLNETDQANLVIKMSKTGKEGVGLVFTSPGQGSPFWKCPSFNEVDPAPMSVTCDAVESGSGLCVEWTLSTTNACMEDGKTGDPLGTWDAPSQIHLWRP